MKNITCLLVASGIILADARGAETVELEVVHRIKAEAKPLPPKLAVADTKTD